MKSKIVLIPISLLLMGISSCKKDKTSADTILTGSWQEFKQRIYIVDSGKVTHDTTYLQPFTKLDYISFSSGNKFSQSTDHYYYINESGGTSTPQLIAQSVWNATYTALGGNNFVLNTQAESLNPGGLCYG